MGKLIRLIDRTRTVVDWGCKRARYYGYEYNGRGIVKDGSSLDLAIGLVIHDAMAAIATFTQKGEPVPIDHIADAAFRQIYDNITESAQDGVIESDIQNFANEQASLTEGLIRGFFKHVWPRLMIDYPHIEAIEQEMTYTLGGGFKFMTKPDLIVANKENELVYLEYKSTSSKKDKWIQSWDTAVQLHSSIMATEETLGIRPAYVQIVGLYKGYESYGKQNSPFCYAYKKLGNPPFTTDQVQYEYKAGFRRYPTWEEAGGVKAWVEKMPDNILTDQFPMTAPIMVDEDLVRDFFAQRLVREREIASAFDPDNPDVDEYEIMSRVFPQTFEKCVPAYGWVCPFRKLCFGHVADPLSEGYVLRTPHHQQELDMFNEDLD